MVTLNKNSFSDLVKNPKKITLDESISIKKIIKQYPYFQIARIIELIGLKKHNSLRFNKVLRDCAIYSTDRSVLYDIIEHEEIDLNSKSYDTINILSSEKTKNSFIEWLKITKPVLKKTKNNNETLISNFLKINQDQVKMYQKLNRPH